MLSFFPSDVFVSIKESKKREEERAIFFFSITLLFYHSASFSTGIHILVKSFPLNNQCNDEF